MSLLANNNLLGGNFGLFPYANTPNVVLSRSTFVPFTVGTNDWQGRPTPFKTANGYWGLCWVEGTQHVGGSTTDWRLNIAFSNDEGATWTSNNTYIGGGSIAAFPLQKQNVSAAVVNECQVILCQNGDLVLIAFERSASWTTVTHTQWRSTDNGASWSVDQNFCTAIGAADHTKIQAVYEHLVTGDTIYLTLMEMRAGLDDTRIRLYKTTDNCETYTFVSNVVEFDEANPDCTESSIADLGNGRFFGVMRTQNLGSAVWKISEDFGVTWGALTEFSSVLGYVGVHQPRVQKFRDFYILMGRDSKPIPGDPTGYLFDRTAFWVSTDLFVTARRQYLDPYYAGNGDDAGDSGYGRGLVKENGDWVFFGYYGPSGDQAMLYKYEVGNTATPDTENYSNIEFFPGTLSSDDGVRLQLNRDNFFEPTGVSTVNGGITVMGRAHNTLETGSDYWICEGTNRPEFFVINDRGWAYMDGTCRMRSVTSIGNTLYRNSFSVGFWLRPADGQPAATNILYRDSSNQSTTVDDRVQISLGSDGKITALYTINTVSGTATTASAVFANGAVTTPKHIAATFTSGGLIRIYVDGVLQTLDVTNNGDISALTMSSYTTSNQSHFGQRQTGGASWDLGYVGYVREILCQPVVWSAGDITNIMLN